jgi:hypothetical protein
MIMIKNEKRLKMRKFELKNIYSNLISEGLFEFASLVLKTLQGKLVILDNDKFTAFEKTGWLGYVVTWAGYTINENDEMVIGYKVARQDSTPFKGEPMPPSKNQTLIMSHGLGGQYV